MTQKSKAVLLFSSDGYEALYIDGKLVKEGDPINEGFSRTKFFINLSKEFNFDLENMQEYDLSDEDDLEVSTLGSGFHSELISYKTNYSGKESNFHICDRCGTEIEKGSYGWYGEYDGQQMCYNCYDSY